MTVQIARLGDICEINPRLPRDHGLKDDSKVSFVPMAAVSEVSGIIESATLRRYAEVKKGYTAFSDSDVLFAKITPCMENGKAALASGLAGGRGFGSTEFHVLRARESVLPEWIYYFVRREPFRREAKRNFTGTAGQQRVPTSFIEETLIPVPPLEAQRRIVDLLARAEGIVRLRREAQQKAAELIPAIFVDMFGDPATNPKQWPIQRLGDVVQSVSGGTPAKARPEFWDGDLPWVSPKDMKRDEIVDAEDHVNRRVLSETSLKLVPPDSVLIVVRGMILVHTVPVAITQVPLTINQDMKALRPASCISAPYLQWVLKVNHAKLLGAVSTAAHGTKKLDTDALMAMPVPVPPPNLQQQFGARLLAVRSIVSQQREASVRAKSTFDAQLARAFG
ncbi:Type I restriction-modification system (Specificity subunit) [Thiomonas sp. X19]|uniref:restriction endonuclease subunit S n=1 Tax=Thiomonas sp. X19 TaxID=1050370 RepID=UPI000B62DD93|nr:restriction endonuclease subunit S [Thiomonas sp. X19]SCC93480.1 Type I restriction-modification system (Specificity subunit) [Thiomonas sp. X19]